ncbi:MAG: ABC transporter substrate-binding protein [Ignisphaera sp.]
MPIKLNRILYISPLLMLLLMQIILTSYSALYTTKALQLPRAETLYASSGTARYNWNEYAGSVPHLFGYMYLSLFTYSYYKDGFLPLLAEKYEWVDPFTVRIYIRPEARWSDGTPITVDDYIYTFRLSDFAKRGPGQGCLTTHFEYVKKISDKVMEIRMNRTAYINGNTDYMRFLGCWVDVRVYPKHIFEQINATGKIKSWLNDDPKTQVVSGPYKLYSYDKAAGYIIYVRIDDWWGKDIFGLPGPKYLVWTNYGGDQQRALALQQGDLDWDNVALTDPWNLWPYNVYTWSTSAPYYVTDIMDIILMNLQNKIFQNVAIRKAIAYVIPYSQIIEYAFGGAAKQPSASLIPDVGDLTKYINRTLCKQYWGNEQCLIPYDPGKARRILDEAGIFDRNGDGIRELPDGTPVRFTILVQSGWTVRQIISDLISNELRKLGFDITVQMVSSSVIDNYVEQGTFDMVLRYGMPSISWQFPWDYYRLRLDPRLKPPSGNQPRYNNSEIIKWIDLLASLNETERMIAASKIQEIIYRDMPIIAYAQRATWVQYNFNYWIGWPTADNPWWWPAWVASSTSDTFPVLFGIVSTASGKQPSPPKWVKPISEGGLLIPADKFWEDALKVIQQQTSTVTTSPATQPRTTTTPPTTSPTTTVTTTTPTTTSPVTTTTSPATTTTPTTTQTATVTATIVKSVTIPTTATIMSTVLSTTVSTTPTTITVTEWTTTTVIAIVLLVVGIAIGWTIKRK